MTTLPRGHDAWSRVSASVEETNMPVLARLKVDIKRQRTDRQARCGTVVGWRSLILATFSFVLLESAAIARDLRQPESGDPAFSLQVPDDWTSMKDKQGNLLIVSADTHIAFSLIVVSDQRSLDDIAKGVLARIRPAPEPTRQPASISGLDGFSYAWRAVNAAGVNLNLTFILVRIDQMHVASCTKIEAADNTAAERKLADSLVEKLRISRTP